MHACRLNGVSDVDYRQWGKLVCLWMMERASCSNPLSPLSGPDHWWQNTRLPYGAMLLAGDFDGLENVLDWASNMIPLLTARSQLLLPEKSSGIYTTETVTLFGLFQQAEFQCGTRPPGYPLWLENSGWVQYGE
jgi:hypothetical protein